MVSCRPDIAATNFSWSITPAFLIAAAADITLSDAEHAALTEIAAKHGATPAQIALKWLLDQPGVAAIPKAGRRESQQANFDALAITLDDADRAAIEALPKTERFVRPAFAPAWD